MASERDPIPCPVCREVIIGPLNAAVHLSDMHGLSMYGALARLTRELEEAWKRERAREQAAQTLCRIYFEIAAEVIGEDEVRRLRDERIDALATPEPGGEGGTLESRAYEVAHWIAMEARVAESLDRSVALASARLTRELDAAREVLEDARDALEVLPPGILGEASEVVEASDGEVGVRSWTIRDELIDRINRALRSERRIDEPAREIVRRELEEARKRERALRDDLMEAIGHLAALVDLYRDGYPESDHAARLVSAAETYLESPSREQDVPSALATPQEVGREARTALIRETAHCAVQRVATLANMREPNGGYWLWEMRSEVVDWVVGEMKEDNKGEAWKPIKGATPAVGEDVRDRVIAELERTAEVWQSPHKGDDNPLSDLLREAAALLRTPSGYGEVAHAAQEYRAIRREIEAGMVGPGCTTGAHRKTVEQDLTDFRALVEREERAAQRLDAILAALRSGSGTPQEASGAD